MRYEHLVEINSPDPRLPTGVARFNREQLWNGLLARVRTPQRFPLGPDRCEWTETEPGVHARTVCFGALEMDDEVICTTFHSVVFTPKARGDATPIGLTITIEEPTPGHMVLRFVYDSLGSLSAEELYYSEYRHNAWRHNDIDMVKTLRDWLDEGALGGLSTQ